MLRLYANYKKHETIKIGNQNRDKMQEKSIIAIARIILLPTVASLVKNS